MIVLGIDPGSEKTGYGIVEAKGNNFKALTWGIIEVVGLPTFPGRLKEIHKKLSLIVDRYSPDFASVEDIFYSRNVKSALKLGHTRGAILLSLELSGVPSFSYTPLEIKKALVGYGRADKQQVNEMVKILLNLRDARIPLDASDALAAALCHINSYSTWYNLNLRTLDS